MGEKETFYLVRADVLPESFHKTLEVKKLLEQDNRYTVQEAVEKVGLSRSAFYKYRDAIFPFHNMSKRKIITISMNLEHRSGILSQILSYIAARKGNILTINQTIPLLGVANVVLSIDTIDMDMGALQLADELGRLDGVRKVTIVGQE